jgi:glucokinase
MSKPVIAIDMGGTRIKIGIIHGDRDSGIRLIPIPEVVQTKTPFIQKTVEGLLHQQRLSTDDIAGLGIASPGIVDSIRKRILSIDKNLEMLRILIWKNGVCKLSICLSR